MLPYLNNPYLNRFNSIMRLSSIPESNSEDSYINSSFFDFGGRQTQPPSVSFEQPPIMIPESVNTPPAGLTSVYDQLRNQSNTPEHEAYLQHLRNAPKESDYKPTKMTKLGALLTAFAQGAKGDIAGGIQMGSDIVYSPYERALRQHEIQGKGLGQAAVLARQTMEDRMQMLARAETARIAQQNYELQKQNIGSQIANRQITAKTAELQRQKLENELGTINFEKIIDKTTGESYWKNKFTGEIFGRTKIDESIAESEARGKERDVFKENLNRATQRINREDQQLFTADQNTIEAERRARENEKSREASVKAAEARRQHSITMQKKAQDFKERLETEIKKGGTNVPSVTRNTQSMMAKVVSEPAKYPTDELFDELDNGALTLKKIDDVDPQYQAAWKELFDLRYKGFKDEEEKKTTTTPGGRTIKRN